MGILLLNKIVRNHSGTEQKQYLRFLFDAASRYQAQPGLLIAVARGVYSYCPTDQLHANQASLDAIVVPLRQYLLGSDSAQREAAYLAVDFLVHLLKHCPDVVHYRTLLPSQFQTHMMREYMHDSVTSSAVGELVARLADPTTLGLVLGEVKQGRAKDEDLPSIIVKSVRSGTFSLSESDILAVCGAYEGRVEIIEDLVLAYLERGVAMGDELKRVLNARVSTRWSVLLLKNNCL